ncbi:hypothetical protein COEX109129_24735 [Corallococcus exiguus]
MTASAGDAEEGHVDRVPAILRRLLGEHDAEAPKVSLHQPAFGSSEEAVFAHQRVRVLDQRGEAGLLAQLSFQHTVIPRGEDAPHGKRQGKQQEARELQLRPHRRERKVWQGRVSHPRLGLRASLLESRAQSRQFAARSLLLLLHAQRLGLYLFTVGLTPLLEDVSLSPLQGSHSRLVLTLGLGPLPRQCITLLPGLLPPRIHEARHVDGLPDLGHQPLLREPPARGAGSGVRVCDSHLERGATLLELAARLLLLPLHAQRLGLHLFTVGLTPLLEDVSLSPLQGSHPSLMLASQFPQLRLRRLAGLGPPGTLAGQAGPETIHVLDALQLVLEHLDGIDQLHVHHASPDGGGVAASLGESDVIPSASGAPDRPEPRPGAALIQLPLPISFELHQLEKVGDVRLDAMVQIQRRLKIAALPDPPCMREDIGQPLLSLQHRGGDPFEGQGQLQDELVDLRVLRLLRTLPFAEEHLPILDQPAQALSLRCDPFLLVEQLPWPLALAQFVYPRQCVNPLRVHVPRGRVPRPHPPLLHFGHASPSNLRTASGALNPRLRPRWQCREKRKPSTCSPGNAQVRPPTISDSPNRSSWSTAASTLRFSCHTLTPGRRAARPRLRANRTQPRLARTQYTTPTFTPGSGGILVLEGGVRRAWTTRCQVCARKGPYRPTRKGAPRTTSPMLPRMIRPTHRFSPGSTTCRGCFGL